MKGIRHTAPPIRLSNRAFIIIMAAIALLGILAATAWAEEPADAFVGELAIGLGNDFGNSEKHSNDVRVNMRYITGGLTLKASGALKFTEAQGIRTEDQYNAFVKANYRVSDRTYLFMGYERQVDHFGLYPVENLAFIGAGRVVAESQFITFEVEAGPGLKTDDGTYATFRASTEVELMAGEVFRFGEKLSYIVGRSSEVKSSTSARLSLSDATGIKLVIDFRYLGDPPADAVPTDTKTAVLLSAYF
jgi:putative salt-induced outer membrane protein YdiY